MRSLLPALLLLGACAAPDPADDRAMPADTTAAEPDTTASPGSEPIEEPGFDAVAWVADVEAAETDAERVALSARLLDAVDWRTACGEDDPTAPGRGVVHLAHLSATASLAEITCQRFAYQNTFALVDAHAGRPPHLVRALGVTEAGTVTPDTTASFFGVLSHDPEAAPERFTILTKTAGHGGCGTDVTYSLRPDGGASVVEVRAHGDCDDPLPPEAWPITYPTDE